MDESFGSQYALQVALQTLKERCQQFQQRIAFLEEENLNLRSKCEINQDIKDGSLPEIDALKKQVAQLTEQNTQLSNNVYMVSAENHRLWARLSKLTQANENLGSKLNQINDTLSQHNNVSTKNLQNPPHTTLIRSKTFTQDEPHLKIIPKNFSEENEKLSLELEDISLKLILAIAKEKSELELQCSQMTEIQNSDTICINSFAFAYPNDDLDNSELSELKKQLTNLKKIKEVLSQNKNKLEKNINNLKVLSVENRPNVCKIQKDKFVTVSVQTLNKEEVEKKQNNDEEEETRLLESLRSWGTPDNSTGFVDNKLVNSSKLPPSTNVDKICPICSKIFYSNGDFYEFLTHVQNHFTSNFDASVNIIP